ncbi:hypothetical protein [Caballeronia sp. NCTM5]|uniref:hypothetical protein n=1 Tax=Caballeronia sp. NCTM5 TaxID=2921755 RepID=UPI0020281B6B|nr:hypothetical protein [Caballeronia sp. NCTM5]
MAQVASYQVPAHPSGLDMRTQLNAIILALIGDNSGPTAPTVTYPGMMWGDTTAMRLKRRTNANDAWVDLGPIDNFLADVTATANNKVSRTGDTMTGPLTLSATAAISMQLFLKAGSYSPHFRSNSAMPGFEWVNGANNAVPMTLYDNGMLVSTNGYVATAGNVEIRNYGSLQVSGPAGRAYIRADPGMTNGYGAGALGMGIINNANNAWNFSLSDNGNYNIRGFNWGLFQTVGNNGDSNGYQGRYAQGYVKLNEYNYGPYVDYCRVASQDWSWRHHLNFNNNYFEFICNGGGSIVFANDGNINSSSQGWFSGKANAGARVQWDSGIAEWGPINGPTTLDIGAPWVMEGWRTNSNGNWVSGAQWLRGVCLRNQ